MELNYTCLILLAFSLAINILQNVLIQRYKKLVRIWRDTCQKWKQTSRNYELMTERLIGTGNRNLDLLDRATKEIILLKQQQHDKRL